MTDRPTLMVGVAGVRGIVGKDLTPEVVTQWARAFGTWVRETGEKTGEGGRGRSSVVVGRDSRQSGPAFAQAVAAGLGAVGCDVIDVGLVPTPTVQLAVEYHAAGGGVELELFAGGTGAEGFVAFAAGGDEEAGEVGEVARIELINGQQGQPQGHLADGFDDLQIAPVGLDGHGQRVSVIADIG